MNRDRTVEKSLLEYRRELMVAEFWPYLDALEGRPASKKVANKFFLGCIIDYHQPVNRAWKKSRELVEDRWGDPADLWGTVSSFRLNQWMTFQDSFGLHRYPAAHKRVWRIGTQLREEYGGDARKLWLGFTVPQARQNLHSLRTGLAITEMVLGGLVDTGQLEGSPDVKTDRHVKRVIGRIMLGREASDDEARDLTRRLHKEDPWALDRPLFCLGKEAECGTSSEGCCRSRGRPRCALCLHRIRSVCVFASDRGL